jgi:hypothetical protein
MKEMLLAAARALDAADPDTARRHLRSIPLARAERPERLVAVALWKRIVAAAPDDDTRLQERQREASAALESMAAAAMNPGQAWNAHAAIPVLERHLGTGETAAIVTSTIWDCVLASHPAIFETVFDLLFRGGGELCLPALEQFLAAQRDYIPLYWHFVLLTTNSSAPSRSEFRALAARLLENTGRTDLAPVFDIYLMQMRQAPVTEIVAAAHALTDAAQRARVAQYMTGMGYMLEELRIVMSSVAHLAGDADAATIAFMQARLATAEGRPQDALGAAELARSDPRYRHSGNLLRALALARLKEAAAAVAQLDEVLASPDAAPFQRARAAFMRITSELVARRLPLPEERSPEIAVAIGRPLAQSLWVGPKLRWIERLCIQSYLDNGWRFQLYVYDEPENVPEGCEILDASVIVPAKEVFVEGRGSGLHAGSVGAFSDLFRYRLLHRRGGMWTDTDVINMRRFEPDGRRFISTEIADAGIVTLNGAIMAAPAGDEMVSRACERAEALLAARESMFFTRIGPYLLAEIALELGVDQIELMPPGFLSPISWMNTASLLQPFEQVMARPEFHGAINVHVYTEMWRTLGLGLDRPPPADTFLGRLYADHCGETDPPARAVRA